MTHIDVNGNTVRKDMKRLPPVDRCTGTYSEDSAGRIMVDLIDGGHVVFFAQDEPKLAERVWETLERKTS